MKQIKPCIICFTGAFLFLLLCNYNGMAQGTWTALNLPAPDPNAGEMMLLSDGSVIAKTIAGMGDTVGSIWDRLTPDIHGSYVNGDWTELPSMHDSRLYFASQVLTDGRVFVAGGEYGTGGSRAEVYDPLANTWTSAPNPGHYFGDANSEILPNGRVLTALLEGPLRSTIIYNPAGNNWTAGPSSIGNHDESAWVKLPDSSILFVDISSTHSERYIPAQNHWVVDDTVPVLLYDAFGSETGAGFLLPDGRAFFLGSTGHTAYYTPSGNVNPGTWTAGPDIPNNQGTPDAAAAMMNNGKILCAVAPVPYASNHLFNSPTSFYEFDYLTNSFLQITAPDGSASINEPSYYTNMLDLPDGSVLFASQGDNQYYIYTPDGNPLAAGKPTINALQQTGCRSYRLTGTLFNGISEGAAYGDDWQMATNYPIVRLQSGANVYYARTSNWNRTGVQTGNLPDTTDFTIPDNIPAGHYALTVIANGIGSDTISLVPAFPQLSSTLTPPAICSNSTFTYTPTSSDPNATFTWTRPLVNGISNPAISIPQTTALSETLVSTIPAPATVVYHYIISSGGCTGTNLVTVVVNPSPATTIHGDTTLCQGSGSTLTATGGLQYLWNNQSTAASISIQPDTTTLYFVTATNNYGCAATDSQRVRVTVCNVQAETICEGYNALLIYPNPADDQATIEFNMKESGDYTLRLLDVLGRTIREENSSFASGHNKTTVRFDHIAKGEYFVVLQRGADICKAKIAVQ